MSGISLLNIWMVSVKLLIVTFTLRKSTARGDSYYTFIRNKFKENTRYIWEWFGKCTVILGYCYETVRVKKQWLMFYVTARRPPDWIAAIGTSSHAHGWRSTESVHGMYTASAMTRHQPVPFFRCACVDRKQKV